MSWPEGLKDAEGAIRLRGLRTEDLRDWTRGLSATRRRRTAADAYASSCTPKAAPRTALTGARDAVARCATKTRDHRGSLPWLVRAKEKANE